ncbi:MAG: hypothetical protein O7F76_00550 [Planctomycetota bacterium]|nr:hypothetical protein [Planctomycetota bacterium]
MVIYDADFVPYPTGACCYGDADGEGCVESTFFDCDSTFLGAGTQCPASGNCDEILGACCDTNDGLCEQTTVEGCDLDGKVYQGDGTTCQDDGCDMTGACCSFDLCVFTNEEVCLSVGGEFLGVGVACEANTCVPTGACVLVLRAQCVILTEDECGAQFGIYSGDDTECG